jgi:hypothetical protein
MYRTPKSLYVGLSEMLLKVSCQGEKISRRFALEQIGKLLHLGYRRGRTVTVAVEPFAVPIE